MVSVALSDWYSLDHDVKTEGRKKERRTGMERNIKRPADLDDLIFADEITECSER